MLPKIALSVQQPWSWLIVNGHKDIENRDWTASHRGAFLVHAGQKLDGAAHQALLSGYHPAGGGMIADHIRLAYTKAIIAQQVHRGGIVGVVNLDATVTDHSSSWFVGRVGFVLSGGRPLPFMPYRGQLNFFPCQYAEAA